ncbi:unnamed protein product [Psylliodes chrysocephalus]|uniref:DUF7869 domain-containing protein n=1 Tax=Psylliodes chrysocephalus TaxID=3402493 RepID=A0A9P0CKI9_9CUCU|nr:unnamed protein product [Psylliodes chrysocephala]
MDHSGKRGGSRTTQNMQEWRDKIREHISSFPSEISHYSRSKTESKYLSPDLSVSKIVPRVDTCSTYDSLSTKVGNTGDNAEKNGAQMALDFHHRKVEYATKAMQADVRNAKHSEFYVIAQLACCNLGIHDSDIENGFMCVWPETVGGRGSLEVANCVYSYLTKQITTNKKKLIVWSDKCGAQNKNQIVLSMYLTLLATGIFTEIIHKFPVKGHTFLTCDRYFGIIEKKKKDVFDDFYDWRSVAKNLNTTKLKISEAAQIRLSRDQFGTAEVWKSHGALQFPTKTNILRKGVTIDDFATIEVNEQPTKHGIPEEKVAHIRAMLPYLTNEAKEYYSQLLG